ncbi:MAG: dihydroorotase family protein [Candidatus Bathyarchaeota archaeon]
MTVDLLLENARAYIGGKMVDCCIAIDQGKIKKIGRKTTMPKSGSRINLKNMILLPGLIDVHVHLRDQKNAYKEDFYSGTAAAASGGITTVIDMPNNNPVTMSVKALQRRMELARDKILVNVGFFSEFPNDIQEIEKIVNAGAIAFKLYLANQIGGLDIDCNSSLLEAFNAVKRCKVPVAVHAEDRSSLKRFENQLRQDGRNDINAFLLAHSEKVEEKAVERVIALGDKTGVHVHLCHISAATSLKRILSEKKKGATITCETTPHNLLLSSEDLKRIGTKALTVPPVREKHHAQALLNGMNDGWIDILASDHAPHTLQEKEGNSVWGIKAGVPGLETMLPLMLTEVNRGRLSIRDLVRLMAEKPAQIFSLKNKGYLVEGGSADLTVIDLTRKFKINAAEFHSKSKHSPFNGLLVKGKPVKTFVGGQLVFDEGQVTGKTGTGEIVRK